MKTDKLIEELIDNETEQALLGAIFIRPECIEEIRRELEPNDFGLEKHQQLYTTMLSLTDSGTPIDAVSVFDALGQNGGLQKAGGRAYIGELINSISTSAAWRHHAEIIKKRSALRNVNQLFLTCLDGIKRKWCLEEVIAAAEVGIDDLKRKFAPQEGRYTDAHSLLATKYEEKAVVIGSGILPEGGGLILAGESGVGKSIIRTGLAIHLVMGWELWGLPVPKSRKVLIIQFENPRSTEQYRLRQMLKGLGITSFPNKLIFADPTIRLDLSLKRDRQKAVDLVKGSGAEVVIWDPLSSIHSANENDNIQIRSVLDTITEINRKANTSAIVIHHFGKPQEGQQLEHRTRGASSIKDWADTLIAVTSKPHNNKILRQLTFLKVRNGPEHKPILLERDKETFVHTVTEEESLCNPGKVAEILKAMGGEARTQAEFVEAIQEATGCSDKSAKKYIKNAIGNTVKEYGTGTQTKGYRLF